MKEYAEYDVREIVERFIDGEPTVAEVSMLPDETNAPKITGTGVEDSSVTEGKITYDIQFRAIIPNANEMVQMIINVEAQNDFSPGYPIIKRGIYYGARMISSQYGAVFTKSHYEKIQKVYSVWICTKTPMKRRNTITEYSLTESNHVGNVKETKEYYDLITVIMICLDSEGEKTENDLLGMLDVLLSNEKKAKEKKEILQKQYDIPMTVKMEKEVERMCNLSEGVEQKGIEKGIKIGIEQGALATLIGLVKDNLLSIEEAAKRMNMTVEGFQKELNKE